MIITAMQVVFRYLLNSPFDWVEEFTGYLLVWFGLFGAVVAVKRNEHTLIDLLLTRSGIKMRKILSAIGHLLVSFMLGILIITGYIVAIKTNYPTVTLPFSWTIVYAFVPIASLLMFARGIENIICKRTEGRK